MLHLLHSVTSVQETSLLEFSCYGTCRQNSKRSHNMCPISQSCTESEMASFVAMLCSLHSVTDVRNFSAMNPCRFRKSSGKPFCAIANRLLAMSAKRTETKEDEGSTMMLAMWLLWLVTKRHVSGRSDVEQ